MSTVITPSMTDQIVLSSFNYLVDAELRKRIRGGLDFRYGCQEGFIAALIMLFGTGDVDAEKSFDKQESWIHLTERIVDEELAEWSTACQELNEAEAQLDYKSMQQAVEKAVNSFAMQHPMLLRNALRNG